MSDCQTAHRTTVINYYRFYYGLPRKISACRIKKPCTGTGLLLSSCILGKRPHSIQTNPKTPRANSIYTLLNGFFNYPAPTTYLITVNVYATDLKPTSTHEPLLSYTEDGNYTDVQRKPYASLRQKARPTTS
jgi:hypothetical protein